MPFLFTTTKTNKMKLVFPLAFMLLIFSSNVFAQTQPDSIPNTLRDEVVRLTRIVDRLDRELQQNEKTKYQDNYKLAGTLDIVQKLNELVDDVLSNRGQAQAYNLIAQANNPTNTELGFSLVNVIEKTLDEVLSAEKIVDDQKRKIKSGIKNLLTGLGKAFPPISIITSVVSTLSSFQIPFIEKIKTFIGRKGKEVDSFAVKAVNPITDTILSRFATRIQPYLSFYSNLDKINNTFEDDLLLHELTYKDFISEVKSLIQYINQNIGINVEKDDITASINQLFDYSSSNGRKFDYRAINTKPEIKKLKALYLNVSELIKTFNRFYSEYNTIVNKLFDNNIKEFEAAKELPEKDIRKIESYINKINTLRNGDISKSQKGFNSQFKVKIQSLTNKITEISNSLIN